MIKSPEYRAWLDEAGWMVKKQTRQTIDGKYAIHIRAFHTNKRRDLDNILKATSDLLVGLGLVDDSQCMALAAEWTEDNSAPMIVTLIELEKENDEQQSEYLQ